MAKFANDVLNNRIAAAKSAIDVLLNKYTSKGDGNKDVILKEFKKIMSAAFKDVTDVHQREKINRSFAFLFHPDRRQSQPELISRYNTELSQILNIISYPPSLLEKIRSKHPDQLIKIVEKFASDSFNAHPKMMATTFTILSLEALAFSGPIAIFYILLMTPNSLFYVKNLLMHKLAEDSWLKIKDACLTDQVLKQLKKVLNNDTLDQYSPEYTEIPQEKMAEFKTEYTFSNIEYLKLYILFLKKLFIENSIKQSLIFKFMLSPVYVLMLLIDLAIILLQELLGLVFCILVGASVLTMLVTSAVFYFAPVFVTNLLYGKKGEKSFSEYLDDDEELEDKPDEELEGEPDEELEGEPDATIDNANDERRQGRSSFDSSNPNRMFVDPSVGSSQPEQSPLSSGLRYASNDID